MLKLSPIASLYPALVCSDLHLTDKEQDEYRWSIFDEIEKHDPCTVVILGDLTDAKDHHSAKLVNRLVAAIARIARNATVLILKGNHDYLLPQHPFFSFLSCIEGVVYVDDPLTYGEWALIPHSRTTPLPGLKDVTSAHTYCFLHQTFKGAVASNGEEMQGELATNMLPHTDTCTYLSGDIHVPQTVGRVVEYVGSPYPVHFGDRFTGRMLWLKAPKRRGPDIPWRGPRRHVVEIASTNDLPADLVRQHDQLKVRVSSDATLSDWHALQRDVQAWCDKRGVRLAHVELVRASARRQLLLPDDADQAAHAQASPENAFLRYCARTGVEGSVAEVGIELLRGLL